MRRILGACVMTIFVLAWLSIGAQQPPPSGGRGTRGAAQQSPPRQDWGAAGPRVEQDAVDRGERLLTSECGFCHGANARGGSGGPDLLRSNIVLDDENGKALGEFLKEGRPEKGMPKFELSQADLSNLAAFLHARVATAINRGAYKILDVLTGDARAGEAYFNGAGRCNSCHSPAGDLKGVGAKYDPAALQGRIVLPPRGRDGRGAAAEPINAALTVAVTPADGQTVTGLLVRITDFDVTLRDASGAIRSWLRDGDAPKVVVTDPLKAHMDMVTKWTDADMHNMTAYLATLK